MHCALLSMSRIYCESYNKSAKPDDKVPIKQQMQMLLDEKNKICMYQTLKILLRRAKYFLFHVESVIAEKTILQAQKCIAPCLLCIAFIVYQRKITTQYFVVYMKNTVTVSLPVRDHSATNSHHRKHLLMLSSQLGNFSH